MRITGSCGIRLACQSCLLARHRFAPVSCDLPPAPPLFFFFLASCLGRCGLLDFLISSWLIGVVASMLRSMLAVIVSPLLV